MQRRPRLVLSGVLATALASVGAVVVSPSAAAEPGDIVISEVMYKAALPAVSDFLELHNRGTTAVDVSGWTLSVGTTATLAAGTVIPAGGWLVGAEDLTAYQATYGEPADFAFVGGLSSTSDNLLLSDAGGTLVDQVNYTVGVNGWPSATTGPSMELVDPFSDNNVASSWGPSTVVNGTPGARNSIDNVPQLQISDLAASTTTPSPNTALTVSVRTSPSATVTLTYKVMHGADVTVPMADDAASPGGAGDGVFAASVPGAGAGELIRYRASATQGGQSASLPPAGATRAYEGVVVTHPGRNAQLPVFEWFIPQATFDDMLANHRCDDVSVLTTIAYQGQVLDGVSTRIKGHHSCNDPEVKWAMELPTTMSLGAPFPYPVDEFALESNSIPVPQIGWEMSGQVGQPASHEQTVRVQKNAQFYSVAAILEKYDNRWRSHHGYDDWAVYEVEKGALGTYATPQALAASADLDKKSPSDGDFSDAWELTQWLSKPDSAEKRAWMHRNLDLPEMANVTALIVAMRQWDSVTKNFYVVRDTHGTGRWRILQWDLDDIFNAGADPKGGDFVTPPLRLNKLFLSLFALPDFTQMHYRRVRTLHDRFLVGNGLLTRFDELTTPYAADLALDSATWGTRTLAQFRSRMVRAVQERRDMIAKHTLPGEVPPPQSGAPAVVVNELQYHPATGDGGEFVELANPSSSEAVDLSGWSLDGPGSFTIPQGTVLPPNGYVVFVNDDVAFRSQYPGRVFVGGEYSGSLPDGGATVRLRQGARVVDEVTYSANAPWPTAPGGSGPSLELTSLSADNTQPGSWAASNGTGTPGAANSASTNPPTSTVVKDFRTSWKYLATGGDQGSAWRAIGFNDASWPSGLGDLGFKNANATTIPATVGRVTYYFRSTFSVPAGNPVQDVLLDLILDDGAVVYLNGQHVARSNMTTGAVTFTTLAKAPIDGAAETTPVTLHLPASALRTGTNTLAVEVHQRATQSAADLTLDGRVTVVR